MTHAPQKHHRRSIRLPGYDDSQPGGYFVTVCTADPTCPLCEIVDGATRLGDMGEIVAACWRAIPDHFPNVILDEWVVMPDHVHGILIITDVVPTAVGATHASPLQHASPLPASPLPASPLPASPRPPTGPQPRSVGAIVGAFKSAATRRVNARRGTPGVALWQRNYYEHVIRDARELDAIRRYIHDNPAGWELEHAVADNSARERAEIVVE